MERDGGDAPPGGGRHGAGAAGDHQGQVRWRPNPVRDLTYFFLNASILLLLKGRGLRLLLCAGGGRVVHLGEGPGHRRGSAGNDQVGINERNLISSKKKSNKVKYQLQCKCFLQTLRLCHVGHAVLLCAGRLGHIRRDE